MHCGHGGDLPSTETKAQSRQASEQKVGWAQQRMNWCFPRAAAIISSCRLYAWHRTRRKHLAWRELKQTAVRGQKVKGTKPLERLPHNFSSWWTLQDLDTLSDSNISNPPTHTPDAEIERIPTGVECEPFWKTKTTQVGEGQRSQIRQSITPGAAEQKTHPT